MKNKKVLLTAFISLILVVLSINSGWCVDAIAQHTPDIAETASGASVKSTIFKFLKVMGGVVLSSIVIFLGLHIYNKLFVKKISLKNNNPDNVLATPKTIDNAIALFIKKNKM